MARKDPETLLEHRVYRLEDAVLILAKQALKIDTLLEALEKLLQDKDELRQISDEIERGV